MLEEAAGLFGLALSDARAIIKSVAMATRQWRTATAFEHDDLERALLVVIVNTSGQGLSAARRKRFTESPCSR
ncbi:MAG: hypothetical protein V3U76_19075 [Granulosicoccus sp.]